MLMFISSYCRRKEDASVEEQQVSYIYKGYKYRIYPTNKQKEYFEQAFGATYAGGDKIRGFFALESIFIMCYTINRKRESQRHTAYPNSLATI